MITRFYTPTIYIEMVSGVGYGTSMARLVIGDNVIAYSEGSEYANRLVEDLEERLARGIRTMMLAGDKAKEEHERLREQWTEWTS